jgi:hypothetical protein
MSSLLLIREQTTRLNIKQDMMYYTHGSLYGRRSRNIDIAAASDVYENGTYDHLPLSIFTCAEPYKPPEMSEEDVVKRLNVLIRTKIVLEENIPLEFHSAVAEDGFLVLTCQHMFELTLSLAHLEDASAPWTVIAVNILVHNHPNEMLELEMNSDEFNIKLVEMLNRLVSAPNCTVPLARLFVACRHAALGACLRLMYVQSLDIVRTSWYGSAESSFGDADSAVCAVTCKLWKELQSEEEKELHLQEDSERCVKYGTLS